MLSKKVVVVGSAVGITALAAAITIAMHNPSSPNTLPQTTQINSPSVYNPAPPKGSEGSTNIFTTSALRDQTTGSPSTMRQYQGSASPPLPAYTSTAPTGSGQSMAPVYDPAPAAPLAGYVPPATGLPYQPPMDYSKTTTTTVTEHGTPDTGASTTNATTVKYHRAFTAHHHKKKKHGLHIARGVKHGINFTLKAPGKVI